MALACRIVIFTGLMESFRIKAIPAPLVNSVIFLTAIFCFSCAGIAHAQATCSCTISFTVARESAEATDIFFGELKAQGPDEARTKSRLESEIQKARSRALEHCRSQYENSSGCLHSKLASSASALQTASFSARKALEDALQADCKKQQGTCKEAKADEIKCVVAEVTPAADAKAGAEGKKEEKGKK